MKAPQILSRLLRRLGLVLLLTLLGGAAGAGYAASKAPTYTAKAYVVAISQAGDPIGALNFAQAYGRVATSGPVLVKAAERLGGDRSGLDRVTAATSPDAPVIEIVATGGSAARTTDVANAVARALAEYGADRKADTRVDLTLLAGATVPDRPTSPRPPLELLVGAVAGLLVGGLAALAGVGRPDAAPAPPPEEVAAEVEPESITYAVEGPAEIAGHLAVWRAKYGLKAITAYRSSAAVEPDDEPSEAAKPVNGTVYRQPIVGRAAVAGMDEDDE